MRTSLIPHRDWPLPAVEAIAVEAGRPSRDAVTFRYEVTGRIGELKLPPTAAPVRTDGLWRTTCFEAFLRPAGGAGYLEFNFSPSGEWAAYAFDAYREGMSPLEPLAPPAVETVAGEGRLTVTAKLTVAGLAEGPWRLGLSAVVEDGAGAKGYWAAAHPPGKADFHHPDCFALDLPEARVP